MTFAAAASTLLRLFMSGVLLVWPCSRYSRHATADAATLDGVVFDDYYRSDGGPCEYYQLVEPGNRSYYLYSPGYPDPYSAADRPQNFDCRWFAKTPSPTDRLVLDCHDFDLTDVYECSIFINYVLYIWSQNRFRLPRGGGYHQSDYDILIVSFNAKFLLFLLYVYYVQFASRTIDSLTEIVNPSSNSNDEN